jgi:hypothetical protein
MKTHSAVEVRARSAGALTAAGSAATVAVLAVVLWLSTWVSAGDVALFLGFELVFVLAPGVVLYRALCSDPGGGLRHFAIGWGLGYALSIFAFAATAALGARDAFLTYPALVLLPATALSLRRHGALLPRAGESPSSARSLALALVAAAALVYVTAGLFGQAPLPERVDSVSYDNDLVWGISLSADALNHFPIADPTVSGEPLRYHTFVFLHMASITQVTGIELTTVALRLWIVPALLLLVLQLAYAGRQFTGRAWAAPVAAVLFLLVGDLDLGSDRGYPSAKLWRYMAWRFASLLSPSFLLGLVLFVPLIVLLHERLVPTEPQRRAVGEWILVALLLAGCAGAQGAILPVVLGGLILLGAWRWVTSNRLGAGLIPAVALCGGALAISYVLLYSGAGTGLEIKPLESGVETLAGRTFAPEVDAGLTAKVVLYPIAAAVASVTLMLALVGVVFALRRSPRLNDTKVWLLALLCTSVGIFFMTLFPGSNQVYFLWYGIAAGVFLSAGGLVEAGGILARLPTRTQLAAAGGAVILAALLVVDAYSGEGRLGPGVRAGLLFLAAGVLGWFAASRGSETRSRVAALAVAGGFLLAGVVDSPLSLLPEAVGRWADPQRLVYDQEAPPARLGLTAELRRGLRWVRDNTPTGATVAVNNHYSDLSTRDPRYFYYSALSERRVFLESWGYTDEAFRVGIWKGRPGALPFPGRLALSDRAVDGNQRALARLAGDHAVTYVLIDKLHGPLPRTRPGRLIFSNAALDVYQLG